MRKLLIVALVAVAALLVCAPAMAWPVSLPWWQPVDHFTCVGKIQTVDTTAGTVTVRVHLASRAVADSIGEDLVVTVATKARVFKATGRVLHPIAVSDLVVGEKLRTAGRVDYSSGAAAYLGKRLVMRHMPIDLVKRFAFRGKVTAVDATAGTLTADLDRVTRALSPYYRSTCAFKVASNARLWVMKNGWPAKVALSDVAVGDSVYAQGAADRSIPSLPVFTIRWMTMRRAATAAVTL
jgi:hypothetical protein